MSEKLKLPIGSRTLELGGEHLGELRDCNALLQDMKALRERFQEDGYLLIRNLHGREPVLAARRQMLEKLSAEGFLDPSSEVMDGRIKPGSTGRFFGGTNQLTSCPAYQELVSAAPVMGFFERFLGGPPITYDFKWLRVVGQGDFTGAHFDVVYMGRGTKNLYTCWTPLGDISFDMGPLAICVGSHRSPEFQKVRETYGKMDVDRDHVQGWFTADPLEIVGKFGGKWATTTFQAGDVLLFGMFTMHMSLNNTSGKFRLSSDTRYQLASDPVDERWMGEKPKGHYAWNSPEKNVSMEDARVKWGI